jgi:small subunit ribosomal protein S9
MAKEYYSYAQGRRKSSSASVRVTNGKGNIIINGKPDSEYFSGSAKLLNDIRAPFLAISDNNYDVSVVVSGGGHAGQVDAIKLGISKALVIKNESLKGTLKKAELLGRDSRKRERKKFGLKSARKKRQFTKR